MEVGAGIASVGVGQGAPSTTLYNYGNVPFFNIAIMDSRGHKGTFGPNKYWKRVRVNEFDVSRLAASASRLSSHGTAFVDTWHSY